MQQLHQHDAIELEQLPNLEAPQQAFSALPNCRPHLDLGVLVSAEILSTFAAIASVIVLTLLYLQIIPNLGGFDKALIAVLGISLAWNLSTAIASAWGLRVNSRLKNGGESIAAVLYYVTTNIQITMSQIPAGRALIFYLAAHVLIYSSQTLVSMGLGYALESTTTLVSTLSRANVVVWPVGGCDSLGCLAISTSYLDLSWKQYKLNNTILYAFSTISKLKGRIIVPGWPEDVLSTMRNGTSHVQAEVNSTTSTVVDVNCNSGFNPLLFNQSRGEFLTTDPNANTQLRGSSAVVNSSVLVNWAVQVTGNSRTSVLVCSFLYSVGKSDTKFKASKGYASVIDASNVVITNGTDTSTPIWNSDANDIVKQLNFTIYKQFNDVMAPMFLDAAEGSETLDKFASLIAVNYAFRLSTGVALTNKVTISPSGRISIESTFVGVPLGALIAIASLVALAMIPNILHVTSGIWLTRDISQVIAVLSGFNQGFKGHNAPAWLRTEYFAKYPALDLQRHIRRLSDSVKLCFQPMPRLVERHNHNVTDVAVGHITVVETERAALIQEFEEEDEEIVFL